MGRAELAPDAVVVIDPAFLGDVVFDAPLVRAIKARFPKARVGIVVRPPADAIARGIPGLDVVHVFDKRRRDRGWTGLFRVARALRTEGYQLALIPHPSPRSALLAHLAGIPDRRALAPALMARPWLTQCLRREPRDTFVSERLRLLDEAAAGRPDVRRLEGGLRVDAQRAAVGRLRVGLALGSQWPTKRWPVASAAELVRALDPRRFELVLVGASSERSLLEGLRAAAPEALAGAVDAVGGTVDDLIRAIAGCDVMIAGDTGPLHIARALGTPVIALFGPTSEGRHEFVSRDVVLSNSIDCRPCSAHGDLVCPEKHHRCMTELSYARVLAAIETLSPKVPR